MPLFAYRAVNAQGKNVAGRVEAANLFDLEQRLARMDLDLITGAPTEQRSRLIGGGRVARPDLINFCFHLEQLAKAGCRCSRASTTCAKASRTGASAK
jgi:type IV pilus assembly protein PilC